MSKTSTTTWTIARDYFSGQPYLRCGEARAYVDADGIFQVHAGWSEDAVIGSEDIARVEAAHREWMAAKAV
jgi:hypothetical protein